ncbi:MAG: glycosyltransferase family 2 protein [Atribacterota bacterium]
MSVKVSIIMPALNEEKTVGVCIDKAHTICKNIGISYEIIVSDNCSTDNTVEIAKEKGAIVVNQPLKGYGAAYLKGFEEAKGEYIIIGDSDDSYDFLEIDKFINKLDQGYDMVIGNRFGGEIEKGAMPFAHRYIGNPILTRVLNFFFGANISDAHCGMRGFRRDILPKLDLKTTGMEFASEMIIKAVQSDIKLTEIPINLSRDGRSRKPHLRPFRDAWRHMRFMLLYTPLHLFFIPGFFFFIIGLFLVITLVWGPIRIGEKIIGFHSLIFGSMMSILGYQLIVQGLTIRAYALSQHLLSQKTFADKFVKNFTLEKGLVFGFIILLLGIVPELLLIINWIQQGFSGISALGQAIFGLTFITLGVQTIFSSFFISSFKIKSIY